MNDDYDDLNKISGGIETEFEKRVYKLHTISESHLLYNQNLFAHYLPIIQSICNQIIQNKRSSNQNILNRVTVLTLTKLMCLSAQFC